MRLDDIRERYGIVNTDDLEQIKTELKKRLKESHPDNNSNFDSDYFNELKNDLAYVENLIKNSENQNTLVPMSEVLQTLVEIIQVPTKKDKDHKEVLNEKLSENIQSRLLITKKHLRIPRIGSATMLTVITFLWMFPNQVLEHPIMQMLFGDATRYDRALFAMLIILVWLLALVFAIIIWGKSIRRERIEKGIMERLKLESVQNEIFMNFLNSISPDKQFSKLDFMTYLAHGLSKGGNQINILHFAPEEEIVQNMADIILLRAKEFGIIKAIKSHSLIDCYKIIQDE